ncbi:MAG: ribosome small subunit-dependent GTPase A [Anaerolineae bacterium]|nr:MAG: ribosome small subunit-dependent GTPase A [Anaerolineae bacterium]
MSEDAHFRGLVIRSQSGFYTVKGEDGGEVVCRLRGRLKRGPRRGDLVAVGDWVRYSVLPDGSGMIEAVEERRTMFSRLAPTPRGEYRQILIANADQAVLVFACAEPEPRLRMLDRFLIVAEKASIPPLIVFNKVDLLGEEEARRRFGHYADLGYPLLFTSAKTGRGVDALRERLTGKVSVLAGPSGVGKSSLLNAVQPDLGLAVRSVSRATRKGRHTTVVREMFPLDGGGYVADTPGLKALALWDIEPEEVDGYFPEIRDLVAECRFSDCTHLHEPECAVRAAVAAGRVHPARYESYIRLRYGEDGEPGDR